MSPYATEALEGLTAAFEQLRNPARAAGMKAYMRHQFPFLGVPTPERRRVAKAVLRSMASPSESDLRELSTALYNLPDREYQYVAVDHAAENIRRCSAGFLTHARALVTTKSWWDTVDGLAAGVVGPLVLAHPQLIADMDEWIHDDNVWVARTAILHQLRNKSLTDESRLFRYCELQAAHKDFFIRKAIGWALREYSKTNPEAVRVFIDSRADTLSGLSKREGMLWITGRNKKPA